jgi:hypothetical protein
LQSAKKRRAPQRDQTVELLLKNPLSIAPRGVIRTGDLPKTCHLLASTAILEPQNRYIRFNHFIRSLAILIHDAGGDNLRVKVDADEVHCRAPGPVKRRN